jgi:enoyl-CoA hydratase/carnithine racemase
MSEEVILTHVENRVATLTLNRPDKLNALSRDLIGQATDQLKQ